MESSWFHKATRPMTTCVLWQSQPQTTGTTWWHDVLPAAGKTMSLISLLCPWWSPAQSATPETMAQPGEQAGDRLTCVDGQSLHCLLMSRISYALHVLHNTVFVSSTPSFSFAKFNVVSLSAGVFICSSVP